MGRPIHSEATLVNGSAGDPVLYVDYPDRNNALLFDAGDVAKLPKEKIADLDAVFLTHHHADHFMDLDRVIRANLDSDKTLNLFGPEGTIERVYNRIRSYAHSYFPFQKLILEVNDLLEDRIETSVLEYQRQFPEPTVTQREFPSDHVVFENDTVRVEAAPTDHTVPGFAYALQEKSGFRFRFERLGKSSLRPGPWIAELIQAASRAGESLETVSRRSNENISPGNMTPTQSSQNVKTPDTTMEIDGGRFSVKELSERFLQRGGGYRLGWIVDSRYGGTADSGLERLAKKADRLFCDCFYAEAQSKAAAKHKHMTTEDAARLIRQARPKRVCLVHFSQRYQGRYSKLVDEVRGQLTDVATEIDADL